MIERRLAKLRRTIAAGLKPWRGYGRGRAAEPTGADVVHPMPRFVRDRPIQSGAPLLPMARTVSFKPSTAQTLARLCVWLVGFLRLFGGNLGDLLLRRASVERRADRLRRIFENTGATFVKLGQQLSLRADLLPYAYCVELGNMLDATKPFPTVQAIKIIERSLGRRLDEVFQSFDPSPIGSASLACVYQAKLKSGEHVAVKVRRPGVGLLLVADLRALDWLLSIAEFLTITRPGLTGSLRRELGAMLLRELNFRAEARYTDIFRRRAAKRQLKVTAPLIYFEHCTDEVMVSEFVSGIWMRDLLAAVDLGDYEFLRNAAAMGIEPISLARRLAHTLHRELLEDPFFHADPHPANLLIMPGNVICFIDFGAVGRFSTKIRNAWRELHHHMVNQDIGRMVHSALILLEPLPPMDVDQFAKAIEVIFADWMYATISRDAEWWERSTAQNWLRYMGVAREFGVPVNRETLEVFRAMFLYDSIIMRLDRNLDFRREYRRYSRQAGKEARRRVQKQIRKRLGGPTGMDYLRIEQVAETTTQLLFNVQRLIEDPIVNFKYIVGKIAATVSVFLRLGLFATVVIGIAFLTKILVEIWLGRSIAASEVGERLGSLEWVVAALAVFGTVVLRKVLFWIDRPEVRSGGRLHRD